MKKGWEVKTLGEVCKPQYGYTAKASDIGNIRYIRITDIDENGLLKSEGCKFSDVETDIEEYILKKDDLLLVRTGATYGKTLIYSGQGHAIFASYLMRLSFSDDIIFPKFYWMFSKSNDYWSQVQQLVSGSAQPQFNGNAVVKVKIPIPPLEEQKAIVQILDHVFERIECAKSLLEANKKAAKELFESALNDTFTKGGEDWDSSELNEYVHFIDYRGKTPPKTPKGVRLITAKNVKMGYINRAPEEFIDAEAYKTWMTRGYPKKGDVLFTTEAPLGNVAQLDTNEVVVIGQRLITMQPDQEIISADFLNYLLISKPMQDVIHSHATGATVQGIKSKTLKKITIKYPSSLQQQKAIVQKCDILKEKTEKLATYYDTKLNDLAELKQSILQKVFAGELDLEKVDQILNQSQVLQEAA